MKINKQLPLLILLISISICSKAQVGFGTNAPSRVSVIDMVSSNKGFLPPRVSLNSTTDITSPITITPPTAVATNSLLVFNTATVNDVTPGYYYFSSATNKWIKLADGPTWNVPGNGGTVAGTNFIGTTDDQDFVIKRNSSVVTSPAGLLNFAKRNTSYGVNALTNSLNSSVGTDNVALGYFSLFGNDIGSFNVSSGEEALRANISGNYNIALSTRALADNNGSHNIALGAAALYKNNTGIGNIAINLSALFENYSGNYNISVGKNSIGLNQTGSFNIGIGVNALYQSMNVKDNIGIGYQTLYENKSENNIAIGYQTLKGNNFNLNNHDTKNNIGIGTTVMIANTANDRNNNIAIGFNSLSSLVAGIKNTTLGQSGQTLLNVNNNTLLGHKTDFVDKLTDNRLNIANTIFGTDLTTPLQKVGIKTYEPNSTLHIQGSLSTKIRPLTSGTVADDDYTILVGGNISLPAASANNIGRIYILVNNINPSNFVITGIFKYNASTQTNYNLSSSGVKSITVQSNGAQWQILSSY